MKVLSIRLPEDLHDEIANAAGKRNVSMSWLIVKVLEESSIRLKDPDQFTVLL